MPRKQGKAVPEGNDPGPHHEEFGPDQPTLADIYRVFEERFNRQLNLMKSHFDQQDNKLDELMENIRETRQRLAGLELEAWQPRLAMEADVPTDKKTRKRAEDAAANQAKHGDSCSAKRVDAGPTSSTSFSMTAEPPALPQRDDVLVDKGAEAPKPCLSPVEIRTLTAAGGLLPTGTYSTAIRTIFPRPLFSRSLGDQEKKYQSDKQPACPPPCWRRVIQRKSRQFLVFDPGGFIGRLRACPFLGGWRTLLCGEVFVWMPRWYPRLERFWYTKELNIIFERR